MSTPAPQVLGADAEQVTRLSGLLGGEEVKPATEPLDPESAPEVLIVWSGRGVTARDALLSRLRSSAPEMRIVVIGPADSPSSVRAALESGADGLVFEEDLDRALAPTVEAVRVGQVSVPASRRLSVGTPNLTAREKQILSMVVLGCTNKEIGARLFLADSTVKSHLSSAFAKLGVRSRHEAVALILDPQQRLGLGILGISVSAQRNVSVAS
jgi:DNA-binding NarL/FixJ family response regulator